MLIKKIKLQENSIYKNLKVIFKILGIYLGILFLQLPFEFMNIFTKVIKIVMIVLFTKLVADCINPKMNIVKRTILRLWDFL